MDTSDLANRMKEYEKRNQYYLQKRTPVAIRVDGRNFHTFTKGFQRPFDKILMTTMQETAKYMCENIQGAKFAYVQSDEITIILVDYDTLETDCWFNYRTDKLCSISASMATMAFNKYFSEMVMQLEGDVAQEYEINGDTEWVIEMEKYLKSYRRSCEKGAMFDSRCFNIPKEEVTNLVYWRQLDATRNSIQMVGQANFSHKKLQGKSCEEIKEMLIAEKGISWEDLYPMYQYGSCCIKVTTETDGTTRSSWKVDKNIPLFIGEGREYIESLIQCEEE